MTRNEYLAMPRYFDVDANRRPGTFDRDEFMLGFESAREHSARMGEYLDGASVAGCAGFRDGVDAFAMQCGEAYVYAVCVDGGASVDALDFSADGLTDAFVAGACDYAIARVGA